MPTDRFDLTPLFALQQELDEEIARNHDVSYESTFPRRLLALLVELGEFANETRCFKYWSNKGPSPKEVILEEYVDGLHFLLSLGIPLGVRTHRHEVKAREKDLTDALLHIYEGASLLRNDYRIDSYLALLDEYLDILPLFGSNAQEAEASYRKKMDENHSRQRNNY